MLSYDDALERILAQAAPRTAVPMSLLDALGLVLAQDVVADTALPPFANSAMDGFAVRHTDVHSATKYNPVSLPVVGEIAAGARGVPALLSGTALRIMTGAPLPPGADTIVPVEDTQSPDGSASVVMINDPGAHGQFVREAGSDIAPGAHLLTQGNAVRPLEIAVAAAIGQTTLTVYRRPRVAIISTGDELTEPGQTLAPGQIYNSNAFALAAQVMDAGGEVIHRLLARDTPEALRGAFDAVQGADIILTSGGVSVGQHDHVKAVFAERGEINFWRIAIRPGKPLMFGRWGETLFFGLPGNPVSSLVTFELFARPALRKMLGHARARRPAVQATLTEPVEHFPGRRTFLRGTVTRAPDGYDARHSGRQGSHQLSALPQTNALLVLPEDILSLPAGAEITALLLSDLPPLL